MFQIINFLSCFFLFFFLHCCSFQVATSTGAISHFVNLQVVVPEAFILGSGELHVDMGSAINLVCIIEKVSTSHHTFFYVKFKLHRPYPVSIPEMGTKTSSIDVSYRIRVGRSE